MSNEPPTVVWPAAPPSRPSGVAPVVRALQAIGVGSIAAAAVGLGTGVATFFIGAETACTAGNDGWCGLGWFLIGIAAAFVAGAVGYIVAGLTWIRKHEPAGRRATPTALHLLAPVSLVTLLWLVSAIENAAL